VGFYFPYGYYRVGGGIKTLSGSVGMFVGTMFGTLIFRFVVGAPETIDIGQWVGVALTATIAEALTGKWDNITIPASVHVFLQILVTSHR